MQTVQDARDADESAAEERDEAEKEVGSLGNGEQQILLFSIILYEWLELQHLMVLTRDPTDSMSTGTLFGVVESVGPQT